MKIIKRNILYCLAPLLIPLTASAERGQQAERTTATSEARGNAAACRASEFIGLNLKNSADETVGEVEDLVLDMKNGEVLAVIVSSGGFLGINETHSAVPVSALQYDHAAKTLNTRLTKEQLGKAPQFKNNEWSDQNDTSVTEALRSFDDSINSDASASTRTGQDQREMRRGDASVTARGGSQQDQRELSRGDETTTAANNEKDEKITSDIRSYIMGTDLSRNAKNIKVSTRNEHVTLNGVVDSEAEHKAIIKIAEIYTDSARISDELEVNETSPQAERTPATSEARSTTASSTSETRRTEASATGKAGNTETSWSASKLMGQNVKNAADESVGKVEDLVLDMQSGEVLAVIISSGGFLGINENLSAVPVSAIRYDEGTNNKALQTNLTKEQLGKAPQFKNDEWPDYNEAGTVASLRSFRDSIGGDVTAPDNSAQNEKEMRKDAVTPMDQGNSEKDVQITKSIRSGIMNTDLSFNAKNIKIITRDEHVTLKGVVESNAEHQAILKIAEIHVNTARITDDLKVDSE